MKIIIIILFLVSFFHDSLSAYRVSNIIEGTNRSERLIGESDTIIFGLRGHDRLMGRSNDDDSIMVGGIGNDRYYAASRSIITIADSGGGSEILYARNICYYCNTTKIATYDGGRHAVFGNTRTRARVVILDWRTTRNRIERVFLRDRRLTYSFVTRYLKRMDVYLGDLSQGALRRWTVYMPSTRDTRNAISYYQSKERLAQRRADRFKQGFSFEPLNSFNDVATVSLGSENQNLSYQYGEILDNEIDQDIDVYSRSTFDELSNLSALGKPKSNALSYAFKYNDLFQLDFANYLTLANSNDLMINSEDVLLHSYGLKGTFQLNKQFKIIVGRKIKKDGLGFNGRNSFFNIANIYNSRITMNQIGFSYDFTSNLNFSASYSEGVGELNVADNFFIKANNDIKLKSYGFDITKKQILSEDDALVFSYSVPTYIQSASANLITYNAFGTSEENIKYSNNKLENYNLAYTHKIKENSALSFSVSRREYDLYPANKYVTLSYSQDF